ncbi:MAG: S1 family peptidase [Actinomycetota bacterium]
MARSRGICGICLAAFATLLMTSISVTGAEASSQTSATPAPANETGAAGNVDPGAGDEFPHIDPATVPEPDQRGSAWEGAVAIFVDEFRERYPEQIGEARITHPGTAVVTFAGELPADLPAFEGVSYEAELGFHEDEVTELVAQVSGSVHAIVSRDTPVAIMYLPFERRVVVYLGEERDEAQTSIVLEQVRVALDAIVSLPGVTLAVQSDPSLTLDANEALGAGNVLRRPYSPYAAACSSAFPVNAAGGKQGILSAGHCPHSVHYWQGGWDIFAYTPSYSWIAGGTAGGDARWYWSSQAFSGETFTGSNFRRLSSAATPLAGSYVCRYGIGTGYACSTLDRTNGELQIQRQDGVLVPVRPLSCTATHISGNGDSGGLWFNGYVGYGVHSGGNSAGSCFTPLPRVLSHFGLSLHY